MRVVINFEDRFIKTHNRMLHFIFLPSAMRHVRVERDSVLGVVHK